MKINTVHRKGDRNVNEDAYTVNEEAGLFAVIDGATGLEGVPGSIASDAVQRVLGGAKKEEEASLENKVKDANDQVAHDTVNYLGMKESAGIEDVPKEKRSTCALAAISMDVEHLMLHYVHAADCMIFLRYENGDIRPVTYDLLQYFDQKAINEMIELRHELGEQTAMADLKDKVRPTLMENRSLINTNAGYGVIDGSADALYHVESGRLSLKKVCGILLLSDGLMLPTLSSEHDAWEQSAALAFHSGLDGLLREVENRENSDPECVAYPRLKMNDDKTGILIELNLDKEF